MHKRALSYAAKTGTEIDLVAVTGADAKHTLKMTPGRLRSAIIANMSEEEVDGLPYPGSRYKNPDGSANNNPDIYLWKDPSKGPDAKEREVSFYVDWADNTPEGRNVTREIEWCKRIGKDNMKIDDIPQKWQDEYSNPQLVDDRLKYLESRRQTIRAAYKEAVRLIWQLDMVNDLIVFDPDDVANKVAEPKVIGGCIATIDKDGTTVLVEDRAERKNWKHYSVGSFLKLDVKKALEGGSTYHALKATEKRDGATGADKTKGKTGVDALPLNAVQTPATSDKIAAIWLSYLDKALNNRAAPEYAAFLKHLSEQKQATLTLATIRDRLNTLFRIDTLQAIADAEKEKLANVA